MAIENDSEPIKMQLGPQMMACRVKADIVVIGGAFFGGKSYCLVGEAGREVDHPRYRTTIFRRTYPQIVGSGGLADISMKFYPTLNGKPSDNRTLWKFPSGSRIKFSHLQHDSDVFNHRGDQICFLGIDQLEEFSQEVFFYLFARNRPSPGYTRRCWTMASCNPEPGWLADLLSWWWNPDTGYPIKERAGQKRYFKRSQDKIIWVDKNDISDGIKPISITFIPAFPKDNPLGLKDNPDYESKIAALDHVSYERYGKGNWLITYSGGMFDPKSFIKIKKQDLPKNLKKMRYWDFAASEVKEGKDPDWTVGALCGTSGGDFYIIDIERFRETPGKTLKKVVSCATGYDSRSVSIRWEEEKGSAGKFNTFQMAQKLLGYDAQSDPVVGDKVERAKPLAQAAENGLVYIVEAPWNQEFLAEAGSFPKKTRDQIDAVDGCMKCLCTVKRVWPAYGAGKIDKFNIDWKQTQSIIYHYGAYYLYRNGSLSLLTALWDALSGLLWIYDGKRWENPLMNNVAVESIKKMQMRIIPVKLIGNDEMFEEGRNVARLLRNAIKDCHVEKGISQPVMYDPAGATVYLNSLFNSDSIVVHEIMDEAAAQFGGWSYDDNGKVQDGFGYCECLCMIGSELKRDLSKKEAPKVPDYHPVKEVETKYKATWQQV
jgi:predicted phage terminase large subunit-like protein